MVAIPPPGSRFRLVARRGDDWWGIRVRELEWGVFASLPA